MPNQEAQGKVKASQHGRSQHRNLKGLRNHTVTIEGVALLASLRIKGSGNKGL
jgi:hypothetical protein